MLWNNWGYIWELQHKVTFDGYNKTITVAKSISEINVGRDIFSDWKEWMLFDNHTVFQRAIEAVGGNELPGGDKVGSTYFLLNGWKIIIDHPINFTGNIYSKDGSSPFVTLQGQQLSTTKVSTLPEKIAPDLDLITFPTAPTSVENANAVRSELALELAVIVEDLLREKRYLGLK